MLIRLVCAIKEKTLELELEKKLSALDVQLKFFGHLKDPLKELVRCGADVIVLSRSLIPKPIESNVSMLNRLPENPITIILNDRESSESQANLMASGADVALYEGISPDSLIDAIESTLESRRQFYYMDRFDQHGRFQPRLKDFVSNSRVMQVFVEETRQIVTSDATLLLLGETGVGKEHLSKAIHAESGRSSGPFIPINMAAIPEQLMESELFGHEQGAFTGAIRSKRGAFEMAHGGTLFLDEIGEMSLQMQSKLLRVLQDLEFVPVGGEKPVWVDVRVIAATNKNIEKEIEDGNFRRDLYYRLGVVTLTIPPLRMRKEDIPAMANHFLTVLHKKIGREIKLIAPDAMDALCRYCWPGNIRELMNVIERAVLLCRSECITMDNLPDGFHKKKRSSPGNIDLSILDISSWNDKTLAEVRETVVSQVEKKYLEMVLKKTGGKVGEAASVAGIHPRGLYGKMKKLGLDKAYFKSK